MEQRAKRATLLLSASRRRSERKSAPARCDRTVPKPYLLSVFKLIVRPEADSLNCGEHWKAVQRNGAVGTNDDPSHAGGPGFESLRAHHLFSISSRGGPRMVCEHLLFRQGFGKPARPQVLSRQLFSAAHLLLSRAAVTKLCQNPRGICRERERIKTHECCFLRSRESQTGFPRILGRRPAQKTPPAQASGVCRAAA